MVIKMKYLPCYKCITFPVCKQRLISIGINMVQYTDTLINTHEYMHKDDFIYIVSVKLCDKCSILKDFLNKDYVDAKILLKKLDDLRELYGVRYHPPKPMHN